MSCGYERRKLDGPKPNYNLIWLLLEKTGRGFCKCVSNTKRAKEKLHPLLDAGENTVTKAEVLRIKYLFASVFISKISCLPGIHPFPELKDRNGEKNGVPITQGERVSNLPHLPHRF